jgi:membrane protein YqaA with SNARE-associated domain
MFYQELSRCLIGSTLGSLFGSWVHYTVRQVSYQDYNQEEDTRKVKKNDVDAGVVGAVLATPLNVNTPAPLFVLIPCTCYTMYRAYSIVMKK